MIDFVDIKGVTIENLVPGGVTVNQNYYKNIYFITFIRKGQMKEDTAVRKSFSSSSGQHTSAHTALAMKHFLAQRRITVLDHPPYLSDLAPCDSYSFP